MIDYRTNFNTNGVAWPATQAINVSAPGAGDGTEFVALMVNDIWGRAEALMAYAGLTPDGVAEAPNTAQILTAIKKGFAVGPGMGVIYWKNGTPAANGDRVLLLQGQVITAATYPLLCAAVYVGDASNPTAPAFYYTSDAGGTTRSTASKTYMVLPDTRAVSLKGAGNQTISTRAKSGPAFGAVQEDQGQGHIHGLAGNATNGGSSITLGGATGRILVAGTQSFSAYFDKNGDSSQYWMTAPRDDGTNGTPRTGATTRDCTLGTNYGITY